MGQSDDIRTGFNQGLEAAATAIEHLASGAAHSAMSMRTKPCRDRRDEEDYERMAQSFDRGKEYLKQAAGAVRALRN